MTCFSTIISSAKSETHRVLLYIRKREREHSLWILYCAGYAVPVHMIRVPFDGRHHVTTTHTFTVLPIHFGDGHFQQGANSLIMSSFGRNVQRGIAVSLVNARANRDRCLSRAPKNLARLHHPVHDCGQHVVNKTRSVQCDKKGQLNVFLAVGRTVDTVAEPTHL